MSIHCLYGLHKIYEFGLDRKLCKKCKAVWYTDTKIYGADNRVKRHQVIDNYGNDLPEMLNWERDIRD